MDYTYWGPRLARNVLRNSLKVKSGETLTMEVWTGSLPWIDAFLIEARKIGAKPLVIYESEDAFWKNVEEGRAKDLGVLGAQEWAALRETNAYVFFWGPSDRTRWHSLPESTEKALLSYEEDFFNLFKEKRIRWCRIELARATERAAKEYGIDHGDWVKELLEASVLNPETMVRNGRLIGQKLESGRVVNIRHPNGTNLELRLEGRRPYIDDGVVDDSDIEAGFGESTIPSGVVMTAVDESFAQGVIRATRPTTHGPSRGRSGGGEWIFKNGRLQKYSYGRGAKDFEKLYRGAGSERDLPAILSIGLNPKIHDSPLLEDQALGAVNFYIGSNEWLGGSTKGNFRSWLTLEGADLSVDGKPLLKAGKIV